MAIAASGTGGHIYPGLAVAAELRRLEPGADIVFFTTRRGLGQEVLSRAGETVLVTDGLPAPAGTSAALLPFAWALLRGAAQAHVHLRRLRVRVLLATGGYGAAPAFLAARSAKVPAVWQEQNALPGRATRLLAWMADAVALGFAEAAGRLPRRAGARARVTGNPVRREILTVGREEGARRLGLQAGRLTVVVVGASQGARRLNLAVVEAAGELSRLPGVQVLVSTGSARFAETAEALQARWPGVRRGEGWAELGRLRLVPYLDDMAAALAAADLAVSRAGAISMAELTARGLPMVLVPYPHASEGHQEKNADLARRAGAAVVVPDAELSGGRLVEVVRALVEDQARLSAMARASRALGRPGAAEEVARLVLEAAARSGPG